MIPEIDRELEYVCNLMMYNLIALIDMWYQIHQIDNVALSSKGRNVNMDMINHPLCDKFH